MNILTQDIIVCRIPSPTYSLNLQDQFKTYTTLIPVHMISFGRWVVEIGKDTYYLETWRYVNKGSN